MSAEFLLGTRLTIHVATIFLLAVYFQPAARFRLGPSLMAGGLLASSTSLACQIIFGWHKLVLGDPQPGLVFFVLTVFLPIAWARGDMAKLYDAMRLAAADPKSWWPWR